MTRLLAMAAWLVLLPVALVVEIRDNLRMRWENGQEIDR